MNSLVFKDRSEAGKKLSQKLSAYRALPDTLVIALPRGGVVVAAEIAKELKLPLDIISPRKIGAPFNPELAIGAITETGEGIFNDQLISQFNVSPEYLEREVAKEKREAQRRLDFYRKGRPARVVKGKTILLVDDGIATGSTMFAAIKTLKKEEAGKIVVAVPVAPLDTFAKLQKEVTEAIALSTPPNFFAVGQFYENFSQTTDSEVLNILMQYK